MSAEKRRYSDSTTTPAKRGATLASIGIEGRASIGGGSCRRLGGREVEAWRELGRDPPRRQHNGRGPDLSLPIT